MKRTERDMYTPNWVLYVGIFSLIFSFVYLYFFLTSSDQQLELMGIIGFGLFFLVGVFLILSWKNESIWFLDEDRFVYKSVLGREITYRFSDIRDVVNNYKRGEVKLVMPDRKISISSLSVLSKRFITAINARMKKK